MHPPEASNYYNAMHAYIHSLARLEGYRGAFDWVYPSHGSLPVSPALVPVLREAVGRFSEAK